MHEQVLLSLAGIGLLGIGCQWFTWWVKLPAILFLLLAGILVGPVLGWLEPEPLFATDPKGRLHFYARDAQPEPKPGWVLLGLIEPEASLETEPDTDAGTSNGSGSLQSD